MIAINNDYEMALTNMIPYLCDIPYSALVSLNVYYRSWRCECVSQGID